MSTAIPGNVTGAQLGCASSYSVVVRARGGHPVVAILENVTSLEWDRRLDDVSQCTVVVATQGLGDACCQALSSIRSWAHEIAIYRNAPMSHLVWEGVLMNPEESLAAGTVKLVAYDMLEWLKVRVNHTAWAFPGGMEACTLVAYMIGDAFLPDDPNVVKHMVVSPSSGVTIVRADPPETTMVWKAVQDICKTTVDITTVGRRIIVMGEATPPWGTVINLGPDDFIGDVLLGQDGAEFYNRIVVVGKGVTRTAKRTPSGAIKPDDLWLPAGPAADNDTFHGLVENLIQLQDATTSGEAYGAASSVLQTTTMPAYCRVQDGGILSPNARVTVQQLVCGTTVNPVLSSDFCLQLPPGSSLQISKVDVKWGPDGEQIGISIAAVNPSAATAIAQGP